MKFAATYGRNRQRSVREFEMSVEAGKDARTEAIKSGFLYFRQSMHRAWLIAWIIVSAVPRLQTGSR